MALSKREREILTEATWLIESEATSFVCFALRLAGGAEAQRLRQYIEKQLHPCASLESWLESKFGINWGAYPDWPDRMRATRLAWIDWMLDQPEAE